MTERVISAACKLGLHQDSSAGDRCTGRRRTPAGREQCECPCHQRAKRPRQW